MAWSAIQVNGNALAQPINQSAHGFSVGDVLIFNGTFFLKAQANSVQNAAIVGMVSTISSMDSFYITQTGFVSNLTTQVFSPGILYYLDPSNPGRLTENEPTLNGEMRVPCFISYSTASGFFFENTGTKVESGGVNWSTVSTDTNMQTNNFYFVNGAGPISMTLPVTAAVGDSVEVIGISDFQISINQNAGQSIIYLNESTTNGVLGVLLQLTTGGIYSGSVKLICYEANIGWIIEYGSGNWSFV